MGDATPDEREKAPGATADESTPDPPYVPGQRPRNAWVAPGSSDVVQDSDGRATDGSGEPTRRRRLLARIPGLSRLAEQSGWVGDGSAKSPDTDPGWVHHDGGEPGAFHGWLYHYADGTMVDADGTQYAFPDEATETETETEPDADLTPDRAAKPEPEPEPEPEPPPEVEPQQHAQPEPEPPAEPVQEASDKTDPEAEADRSTTKRPAQPGSGPPVLEEEKQRARSDIPRFVEYSPTNVRGYLLGSVFLVSAVAGVLTAFVALSEDSTPALVIAGGCGVLALVSSWALISWKPTVVSIREGVLEITRGEHSDRFELEDPSTVVEFSGRPGSPAWTAMVKHSNGPRTILRSSHVKPRQFERIVRHHRARQEPGAGGATQG